MVKQKGSKSMQRQKGDPRLEEAINYENDQDTDETMNVTRARQVRR
jgi:hypothetical protein